MDDNPYRPPAEPAEPIPKPSWPPVKLWRAGVLYLSAFAGGAIANAIQREYVGPLANATGMAFGVIIGLGVAVAGLLVDDARTKAPTDRPPNRL